MNPKPSWNGDAAADACAAGDSWQIGGFLKFANGDMKWFSERWTYTDFHELDIPVSMDMQKDISSFETQAQIGLLFTLNRILPAQRLSITLRSQSDNTAAESTSNSLFSTKVPLCFFLNKLCLLSAIVHAQMDVTHILGYDNDLADTISRMDISQPLPLGLQASDRIRIDLRQIWFPTHEITVFPKGSTVSCIASPIICTRGIVTS